MTDTTRFTIGADASCIDGLCGHVSRVVVDPVARVVTHLVVEPKGRRGLGKLVPLDIVDASGEEVRLSCSTKEFDELDAAEETHYLPGTEGFGYAAGHVYAWPYYARGLGTGGDGAANINIPVTEDVLPPGEVAVRRGEQVRATDGDIGHVQGLVVAAADHHVTHVLLQEGHLWGRKTVAIPIVAVTRVDDGIQLDLTKEQVGDLPPIEVESHQS